MRKLALVGILGLFGCGGSASDEASSTGTIAVPESGSFELTIAWNWDQVRGGSLPAEVPTTLVFHDTKRLELAGAAAGDVQVDTFGTVLRAASLDWNMLQGYPTAKVHFDRLSFRFVDDDGDGTADRVLGEGDGSVFAWWGDYGGTYPFSATITGLADRTPPSLTPPVGELTPFSSLVFAASDDVADATLSLTVDGAPFDAMQIDAHGPSGVAISLEPSRPLPWGAEVGVHVEALRDHAGNEAAPFFWTGKVIDRPADPPSPSFAAGLSGYVARGVQTTDSAALPIDAQGDGILGFVGEPWSLLFEIDVPDTEAPRLRAEFWAIPGGTAVQLKGEIWSDSAKLGIFRAPEPTSQPLASPVPLAYGSGSWRASGEIGSISERATLDVDLSRMRGERAVVRLFGGADMTHHGYPMPLPLEAVLLDGLRVDPE